MNKKLNPNCSETVTKLTIEPEEMIYARALAKKLCGGDTSEYEELCQELEEGRTGGDDWISEGLATPYATIRDIIKGARDITNKEWWNRDNDI